MKIFYINTTRFKVWTTVHVFYFMCALTKLGRKDVHPTQNVTGMIEHFLNLMMWPETYFSALNSEDIYADYALIALMLFIHVSTIVF